MKEPRFSSDQRRGLKRLGLSITQIDELEKKLPLASARMSKPARRQEVREELRSLDAAICRARKAVTRLSRAGSVDYRREAFARVIEADDAAAFSQAGSSLRKIGATVRAPTKRLTLLHPLTGFHPVILCAQCAGQIFWRCDEPILAAPDGDTGMPRLYAGPAVRQISRNVHARRSAEHGPMSNSEGGVTLPASDRTKKDSERGPRDA